MYLENLHAKANELRQASLENKRTGVVDSDVHCDFGFVPLRHCAILL